MAKPGPKRKPLADRFWPKVEVRGEHDCWGWRAHTDEKGYGRMHDRATGLKLKAHRVSYMVNIGDIPEGAFVLHSCDNPECCNPAHLFLGNNQDNVDDMVAKKRHCHGESHPLSTLTDADIVDIRKSAKSGVKQRALARKYRVSEGHMSNIVRGIRWSHV